MTRLSTILRRAMSCEKSSQLVSDALDRDLRRDERFAVWMHQIICWPCRHFAKQMKFLGESFSRRAEVESEEVEASDAPGLSDEAKQRIGNVIRDLPS